MIANEHAEWTGKVFTGKEQLQFWDLKRAGWISG